MINEKILLLIIGAFIGIVPAFLVKIIYDSFSKESKKESISIAIISELKEIKYQYLLTIYNIYSRYSLLDHENIEWLHENLKEFEKLEEAGNILKLFHGLTELTDLQIKAFLHSKQSVSTGKSLIPKKSRILFIEQNMDYIDLFDTDYQYKIIKIMRDIDRLNQQIDIVLFYERKTFEIEDEDNHKLICQNLDTAIMEIGTWGQNLVNIISEFIEKSEKSNLLPFQKKT